MYSVYVHTNKINGKKYVGVTTGVPEYRWNNGNGYNKQLHFFSSIKKYGWDNFDHIVFEVETKEEMLYLEKYLIGFYNTMDSSRGYNKSRGGESGNNQMKNSYSDEYKTGYNRLYNKTHQEQRRQYYQEYTSVHNDELKEKSKEYYSEHKDIIKDRVRKYKEQNPEKVKERNKKWAAEHKDELYDYHKKWVEKHKEEYREYHRAYLRNWRNKQKKLT